MGSGAPGSTYLSGSAHGSSASSGARGSWLGAGLLSLAVHGGVLLAALALWRVADPPVPPVPPVSVEIVMQDPAPPAPAPALRPEAVPVDTTPPPEETPAQPPPPPPEAAMPAVRPVPPPLAPPAPPEPVRTALPPPAPAVRIVTAPVPRPRPARLVPAAAHPRPEAKRKPRLEPAVLPLAAKAPPARATGNEAPADRSARPAAGNPPPAYPRAARRRGLEGRLVLRVRVGPDGAAREVEVIESSGHRMLDASAREAVAGWRFTPARRGGSPVASRIDIPVRFRLGR